MIKLNKLLSTISASLIIFSLSLFLASEGTIQAQDSLLLDARVPVQAPKAYILNAAEIEARDWMLLPKEARAAFVLGFLTGLEHLYASTGVKVLLLRPLSPKELAKHVFVKLTYEQELRNGPIAVVILNALNNVMTLTTNSGSSLEPGLNGSELNTKIYK